MQFDVFDRQMRVFETSFDYCVLPQMFMIARLDGRSFTHLTRDVLKLQEPYDLGFRNKMIATVDWLMANSGLNFIYANTHSDEISLLFHLQEQSFNRKLRKLISILAGEASAKFSALLHEHAVFDCRISQLPTITEVVDYFRWRAEDAHRNALYAHCFYVLRGEGRSAGEATSDLHGLNVPAKNELLYNRGINFNDIPSWQKRGVGLYWEPYNKEVLQLDTGEPLTALRRRVIYDLELPSGFAYGEMIRGLVSASLPAEGTT